jgi:polysaccharide biosynthesis transport protein
MKRPTNDSFQLDSLAQQRRRAAEIKRGIRDLQRTVRRLRWNEDLYDDNPPPADDKLYERSYDEPSPAQANGQAPMLAVVRPETDDSEARHTAQPASILHSNISAFQRAIERLRGEPDAERAGGAGGALVGGPMELLEYWHIIRKRLWLLLLLMTIGGSGMAYYMYQQPPQYRSTTTLYLNPAAASTLLTYSYDGLQAMSRTYSEFIKTRSFAHRVSQELDGALSEGRVSQALSTEYVVDTQFFRINATYTDPQLAQSLANTAARVLIDENIARQQAEQEQREAQSKPNPERERLEQMRTNLQHEIDLYNDQLQTLQSQLNQLKAEPESQQINQQILNVQQQLGNVSSLRMSAMTGLADAQASLTSTANNIQPSLDTAVVVDAAPLPSLPLPRRLVEYTLVALLASLAVGGGIAFLIEYMDYTIKRPELVEPAYGAPAQGVIGISRRGGRGRSPAELITLSDPHSPVSESFRALRTGVSVAGLALPLRSLMITSARPGEGKTFVAANLAVSLAQNGTRVILVDADLRKPSLHYLFDLPLDPGFTDLVLKSDIAIDDVLQVTPVENLRVLTCGIIPPNPAELLGSERAAAVMEQLSQHADIVIFDTAPAATVTDAVVIAPRVDAVLHVIQAGGTRIDLVRGCKAILERGGARILGPVLNQVRLSELQSYSFYYSYSYYDKDHQRKGKQAKSKQHSRSRIAASRAPRALPGATAKNGLHEVQGANDTHLSNGNGNGTYATLNANGNGTNATTNGNATVVIAKGNTFHED